jgi:predicted PurR-regulated permease PerM
MAHHIADEAGSIILRAALVILLFVFLVADGPQIGRTLNSLLHKNLSAEHRIFSNLNVGPVTTGKTSQKATHR